MPFNENQPEPLVSPITKNSTDFHYQEIKEEYPYSDSAYRNKREKYRLLRNYNTGVGKRKWSDQSLLRYGENLARFDAIAGQLKLEMVQKRRAKRLYSGLDFQELGRRVELWAFCVCAHVCNQDERIANDPYRRHRSGWKRYHPQKNDDDNDPLFMDLAKSIGLRTSEIQSGMAKLRQILPDWLFQ